MSFRTICIKNRGKLSYSLNYLIFRGEEEKKIHLSEITTLIVQSTAIAITTSLLSEISKRKIKVIFCDSKCNPQSELIPYYGTHNTSNRLKEQATWSKATKDLIWQEIVRLKILSQARTLKKYDKNDSSNLLKEYAKNVLIGDKSNREGHAAKVYFNSLFGNEFNRNKDILENVYLNYGYSILLSSINREIVSHGYITQLGIHHCNEYNDFNLGCDLMEPFRPIIDDYAKSGILNEENFKKNLNSISNIKMVINKKETFFDNAIKIYVQSIFKSISERSISKIVLFESYEL